ncbi:hypothetical protein ACJJIF_02375 [Microbulbifer sp. SSSA002]|uniref:hypothetical protein n=1 Tax=Microbulbifer sp. SSSA002 TaxID=3243376 RepID=UPI004039629B
MKIIIVVLLLVYSVNIWALETEIDEIKRISSSTSSVSVVWAETSWGDSFESECATTSVVAIDTSGEAGRSVLSVTLLAFMSNKKVKFEYSDKECLPVGGWAPKVLRVDVFD